MDRGIRLGRIAGVEIVADWSLLIIFFLIAFTLAVGVFPNWHPEWSAALNWLTALAAAVLFLASVLVHELSHAIVGRSRGIPMPRITLFVFGGMAHMESEPPTWRAEFAMAIVGPLTSLALGAAFILVGGFVAGPIEFDPQNPAGALAQVGPLATLLLWLGPVNIVLGIFNLVPGFPLDGGRVLRALLWAATGDRFRATRWAARGGQLFAWLLIGAGIAMILGARVPVFGSGFIGGLWLAFIGWFLNSAAEMSYRQMLAQETLGNVPVARLMRTRFARVDPWLPLDQLVEQHMIASGQRVFPVEERGRFLGLVCVRDLQKAARQQPRATTVADVMTPRTALATVSPNHGAGEATALLARRGVAQLPVLDGERLVGLLHGDDVLTWLTLHEAQAQEQSRHGSHAAPH
jgi:Zn-dependent protease/CBS domain-containing protein